MHCIRDDCFLDLQSQLAVFGIVRLTVMNIIDYSLPRIGSMFQVLAEGRDGIGKMLRGQQSLEHADLSSVELQSRQETYSSFNDFEETLISHGYASFFAVSSPWVCVATLLWTILEIILDMKDITEARKRPFPMRVRGTGPWAAAFEVYGVVAAVTNVTLLVFASDQYRSWTPSHKCVLFVYLAHVVAISYIAVKALFPELPRSVEMMQQKHDIIVQRCLENITVEQHQQEISQLRKRDIGFVPPPTVLGHDPTDYDEDDEPLFCFSEALTIMMRGIEEHLSRRVVISVAVCFIVCVVIVVSSPLLNHL